jgi:hypothetical protein
MFTNRFVVLPIQVYNKKQQELTGNEDYENCTLRVLPMEICEYYPYDDDGKEVTQIFLKNERGYQVDLSIEEFEEVLNKFS